MLRQIIINETIKLPEDFIKIDTYKYLSNNDQIKGRLIFYFFCLCPAKQIKTKKCVIRM